MWVLTETRGENGMGGYGMLICWRQKRRGRKEGQKNERRKRELARGRKPRLDC